MTDAGAGTNLMNWIRRPAFSMGLGFILLMAGIMMFSRGPAKMQPAETLDLPAVGGQAVAPPTRELDITINDRLRDSGPYRVEVVNPAGQKVWSGLAALGPTGIEVKVQQRMTAGEYFLQLYTVSGEKLKGYDFRIGG